MRKSPNNKMRVLLTRQQISVIETIIQHRLKQLDGIAETPQIKAEISCMDGIYDAFTKAADNYSKNPRD